jgi:hypothetical protein
VHAQISFQRFCVSSVLWYRRVYCLNYIIVYCNCEMTQNVLIMNKACISRLVNALNLTDETLVDQGKDERTHQEDGPRPKWPITCCPLSSSSSLLTTLIMIPVYTHVCPPRAVVQAVLPQKGPRSLCCVSKLLFAKKVTTRFWWTEAGIYFPEIWLPLRSYVITDDQL